MAHSNLGVLLAGRGDMAGAETAYRAAIAADPQEADAFPAPLARLQPL